MSAQINLYDPRFLKVEDWLNLRNLLLVVMVMLLLFGVWTGIARHEAERQKAELASVNTELDAVRTAVEAATQQAARPADPRLVAEVDQAQAALKHREGILHLLESGAVGNSIGFSEYLRGFARQTPSGLWLTGFSLGAGGGDMEIRGRAYDEKALPDYIRRLATEKIFQGRVFSALSLRRDAAAGSDATAVPPAPTFASGKAALHRPLDFVLTPATPEDKE